MTYAGSFHAGPRQGGGFAVTATLPFDPAAASEPEPTGEPATESQPREGDACGRHGLDDTSLTEGGEKQGR